MSLSETSRAPVDAEGTESLRDLRWWEGLPKDEPVVVMVKAITPEVDHSLGTKHKRLLAARQCRVAVDGVVAYIQDHTDVYPGFPADIRGREMNIAGMFVIRATPVQCDDLMGSGLVDAIFECQNIRGMD